MGTANSVGANSRGTETSTYQNHTKQLYFSFFNLLKVKANSKESFFRDANSVGANLDGGAKRVDSSKPLHHIYKEDNKYYSRDFF